MLIPQTHFDGLRNLRSTAFRLVVISSLLTSSATGAMSNDEPSSGGSSSPPSGSRQSGSVGRNPSPGLNGISNDRLVQARARIEAERATQTQRVNDAYRALQDAQRQGGGGYDSPEQSRLIDEYNRSIRLRDAQSKVSTELKGRGLRADGKWDVPHSTRNAPPRDVFKSSGSGNASSSASSARSGVSNADSVAMPNANTARGRSDTIAEGRSSGSSSEASRSSSGSGSASGDQSRAINSARDNTLSNGSKPNARGDATMDVRNGEASQNGSAVESQRSSGGSASSAAEGAARAAEGSSSNRTGAGEAESPGRSANARVPNAGTSSPGTNGRASSPAPVTGGTLFNTTRDAQGSVSGAVPFIVGADLGARIINRSQDVAEGREVSSTGEFVAETGGQLAVGALVGTVAGVVGGAAGGVVGGVIGFIATGGNPAGAAVGTVQGAQLGVGATVGVITAIGAIRSGESLYNALDRAFFNGDAPIQNQDELLRTGLGDVPNSNQVAACPLSGPNEGNLAVAAQPGAIDQVQSQLLAQFPELANASPEEQREIAMQVLGLSGGERDQILQPMPAESTPPEVAGPVERGPLHPVEPPTGGGSGEDGEPMQAGDGEDIDALLDGITGPRDGFDGSALEDLLDQLGEGPANVDPNAVVQQLGQQFGPYEEQFLNDLLGDFGDGNENDNEMQGVGTGVSDVVIAAGTQVPFGLGDEGDFADPGVTMPVPVAGRDAGEDIDVSIFNSAQERDDRRDLFRTGGDYDEAMRLEDALQRAEAAYRRAIAEARRLAAAQRAAEAAERQRQAQIAYNNWLARYQAWQQWTAQQQAYRNWVAQQQKVSYYNPPQRSAGHQSGGLISDPAQ